MKFDLIISNPPYNHNIDLTILNEIYHTAYKICFVHPIGYLQDIKNVTQIYATTKNLVCNDISSYTFVDAQKEFSVILASELGIVLYEKNKGKLHPSDFDKHGNSDIYKSIKHKILEYTKSSNIGMKLIKKNTYEFECGIRHHDAGYIALIVKHEEESHIGKTTKWKLKTGHDSLEEATNFRDYCKLKITRFCLSILQNSRNIYPGELSGVPYMPTYTRTWTDEDVAKELGLTDEELAWCINWISDYYPEDAEKYAKYKL